MPIKIILFIFLFILPSVLLASDDTKVKTLIKKCIEYEFANPELSEKYCDSALTIAEEKSNNQARAVAMKAMLLEDKGDLREAIKMYAKAYNIYLSNGNYKDATSSLNGIGTSYKHLGMLDVALKKYRKALKLALKHNCKREESIVNDNIGIIYSIRGNEKKSLGYYLKSRKINEDTKDTAGLISSYNLIARSFEVMEENDSALFYLTKSMRLAELYGDSLSIGDALNNLGYLTKEAGDIRGALKYYQRCIEIRTKLHDYTFLSDVYDNAALSFMDLEKYDSAFVYMQKAMEYAEMLQNKEEMAHLHISAGEYYLRVGDWRNALERLRKGYDLANENALYNDLVNSTKRLSKAYAQLKDFENAYLFQVEFTRWNDSLNTDERTKEMTRLSMQYDFDKQQEIQKLEREREKEISDAKIAQQEAEISLKRSQQYYLFGGLALVLIFAFFMFNRFKVTQKQKSVIEKQKEEVEEQKNVIQHQKHEVEEKNKEITDSINYAKRIQEAILPSRYSLVENLKNGFVLYKPKDIVAGDFYWLEKVDDTIYFAAADCTGHGVPGAMVSVVCSNALSKTLLEEGITEPGKILDRTRELVIEKFSKSGNDVKDGMDISLCKIQFINDQKARLFWSGANNPLWIIRNDSSEVDEVKPNKQPIGKYSEPLPFTTHEIELNLGDAFYIFTDGFSDQFGGLGEGVVGSGKKFKAANFKKLLLSIQSEKMDNQKELINSAFEKWRGELEQVDDVCVIGVRL